MENYELTLVLPEKATPAKKKSMTETIGKIVKTLKGEVKKADDWGKVDLAYEIKGNNAGNFLFYQIELDKSQAPNLEQKVRMEEGIVRHLLVREE